MDYVTFDLFTDGSSYIEGDYYESSSACLLCYNNTWIQERGKFHVDGTVSAGEARAVLIGLQMVDEIVDKLDTLRNANIEIRIYLDSAFVRDSLDKWVWGWSKVGKDVDWINSSGKPVAHQDIFKKIFYEYIKPKKYKIKFYKINGHIGVKIKFKDAYRKFKNKNNVDVSEEDFKLLVNGNNRVDQISDMVRKERLYKYRNVFKKDGDNICHSLVISKDKRIEIKKRKK